MTTPDEEHYLATMNHVLQLDEPVQMDMKFAASGADSLDLVEMVMAVEELFELSVDVNELAPIETPRQLYNLFWHHISEGITGRDLPGKLAELSLRAGFEH